MKAAAVVLNGASSAGKTSIARAIQRLRGAPVLHASLDTFTDMFDWPSIPDWEERRRCHGAGVGNFHAALPILASHPYLLVVDHVFEQHAWCVATLAALAASEVCLVGVRCPLAVLESREKARGDRRGGLARFQFERVHEGKPYDLEVDTSEASAEECAARILAFVDNAAGAGHPRPGPDPH
jgi:chloramphenicol 3-O phosphotransferase